MLSIQELKSSSLAALQAELSKARQEAQSIRIGVQTGHIKDTSLLSKHKRYVARVLSCLREAQLDDMVSQATKA